MVLYIITFDDFGPAHQERDRLRYDLSGLILSTCLACFYLDLDLYDDRLRLNFIYGTSHLVFAEHYLALIRRKPMLSI